jgi:type IV pilus assembly protein PilV
MNISAQSQQSGSVILEALIAILIFSLGILSLVGMQATAINTVSDSQYRGSASFLADQMVGTIWAARLGTTTANASDAYVSTPDPGFKCNPCGAANGNAYTQAWYVSGVQANLPQGTAVISMVNNTVIITVGWQSPKDKNPHQHVVSSYVN